MSGPCQLLDTHPRNGVSTLGTAWWREVERSLTADPASWREAVSDPRAFGQDRAWVLLAWAETAATVVLREQRNETLVAAVQVLALLHDGPLDRRDVMVVGPLLHRAAQLIAAEYPVAVTAGCARAGDLGVAAATWLTRVGTQIPGTHREILTGPMAPRFVRRGTYEETATPAPPPTTTPLRSATIRVTRTQDTPVDSFDRHDAIVRVDGRKVGLVAVEGSLDVRVTPGRHEVRIRLRFNPNAARIVVDVEDTVTVVCAKARLARNTIPPRRYWRLSTA